MSDQCFHGRGRANKKTLIFIVMFTSTTATLFHATLECNLHLTERTDVRGLSYSPQVRCPMRRDVAKREANEVTRENAQADASSQKGRNLPRERLGEKSNLVQRIIPDFITLTIKMELFEEIISVCVQIDSSAREFALIVERKVD